MTQKISWEVRRMPAVNAARMIFSGRFVLFVVQKEFHRSQLH